MKSLLKTIKNVGIKKQIEVKPKITIGTCLHEAGHYMMAYMFQTNFVLQFITFDKVLTREKLFLSIIE